MKRDSVSLTSRGRLNHSHSFQPDSRLVPASRPPVKIVASQLKIIDWDTPDDKRVLGSQDVHLLDGMR